MAGGETRDFKRAGSRGQNWHRIDAMAHDVFISYATEDKPVADAVVAKLESSTIRCWIAPRDIWPGSEWGDSIMAAIGSSRALVLVFTSHANGSPQVRREVQTAFEQGLLVIPLRVEDVRPERGLAYYLGPVHWLDAMTPPLEAHLTELVHTVRRVLGTTPGGLDVVPEAGATRLRVPEPSGPTSGAKATSGRPMGSADRWMAVTISLFFVCVVIVALNSVRYSTNTFVGESLPLDWPVRVQLNPLLPYWAVNHFLKLALVCAGILLVAAVRRRRWEEVCIVVIPAAFYFFVSLNDELGKNVFSQHGAEWLRGNLRVFIISTVWPVIVTPVFLFYHFHLAKNAANRRGLTLRQMFSAGLYWLRSRKGK